MTSLGINNSNPSSLIANTKTLSEAREIARKTSGSEFIKHEKDGSYSVKTLDASDTNKVENKPDSKYDTTVVEFILEKGNNNEVVVNDNASLANKTRSYKTTAGEKIEDGLKTVKDKTKQAVDFVEDKIDDAGKAIESGVKTISDKVDKLVSEGKEFLSPLSNFVKNPFTQLVPGMRSSNSNCGPTSGAIIAESFFPGISKGKDNIILNIRDVDGPKTGALSEKEVINGVSKITNGKVKGKVISDGYRANDKNKLLADIKQELNKGNLLMMCTGFSKRPNGPRHYVVVVGIDDKNNLLVSDPYKKAGPGTPPDVWSADKLQDRLNRTKTARNKTTSLTSFEKVSNLR